MERVLKRVLSILKEKLRIGFSIRLRVFSFKVFFFPAFLLLTVSVFSSDLPHFQLKDQKGKILNSRTLKDKTVFLLGCSYVDIVLCRKHGRKIYWRMQNLIDESKDFIEFVAFIDLRNAPSAVQTYINENKSKNYESILLDPKGILSSGIRPNFSWLRIFSRSKKQIFESYYKEINDQTVDSLYEIVRKQRK
ncbi:hypothetical protein [Leptospira weilii]|uniref:hypothetical protein n=1 Tax=Leptospira weilii TaxID=28184 RepID=UPI0011590756|nr:hypothetical protein [Leptospira weilii]QDK21340.1 hypothetical protein FHG67_00120 [Leptospira weilii]QDK25305.1 hypothetical protein FHG68_00120 [Leptospira weilii]